MEKGSSGYITSNHNIKPILVMTISGILWRLMSTKKSLESRPRLGGYKPKKRRLLPNLPGTTVTSDAANDLLSGIRFNSVTLTSVEIRKFFGSLVYVVRDSKGSVIYIGKSYVGISRPFASKHHVKTYISAAHEIEIIPCESPAQATQLENLLLNKFNTQQNRTKPSVFPVGKTSIRVDRARLTQSAGPLFRRKTMRKRNIFRAHDYDRGKTL